MPKVEDQNDEAEVKVIMAGLEGTGVEEGSIFFGYHLS